MVDFRGADERDNDRHKAQQNRQQEQADYKRKYEELRTTVDAQQAEIKQLLAEAREAHERIQLVATTLRQHFDKSMDYNKEMMDSLHAMFGTVVDAHNSFLNQPRQTSGSDANVTEMLKLLAQLSQDETDKP